MTRQEVVAIMTDILRDVLDSPELKLEESTQFLTIPEWDSVAFVTLMAELENQCKVQLDMGAMQSSYTVGDVVSLISETKF